MDVLILKLIYLILFFSKVSRMDYMFFNCSSLTSINLINFDITKVTLINHMFKGCSSLKSLDLSYFDTSNMKKINNIFYNCSSLIQFDDACLLFGDGVCYARIGDRKGLINTDGAFIAEVDEATTWIGPFRKGVTAFKSKNGKMGLIGKSGEILLPPIYKNIFDDEGKGFIVEDTLGNRGYVNNKGRFILPCKYDDVGGMQDGMMAVATSTKCGYVDSTGIWVINPIKKFKVNK